MEKLWAIVGIVCLGAGLFGCQGDLTGKALSSYLGDHPIKDECKVKRSSLPKPLDPFKASGKKVILDKGIGHVKAFGASYLAAGTKLDVIFDEHCVLNVRKNPNAVMSATIAVDSRTLSAKKSREQNHVVVLDSDMTEEELERTAQADPCVVGVGSYFEFYTTATPDDPRFSQQEHLQQIRAAEAWDTLYAATGGIAEDVIIAIVDSGVEVNHQDLRNNMWENPNETPDNGKDDDGNGYTDDYYGYNFASNKADPNPQSWPPPYTGGQKHGTHVAGLSAAITNNAIGVSGVMGEKVKIMALNVFGAVAGGNPTNIANAVRYAADNGAHVANLSLGGPGQNSTMISAIAYAIGKGTTVVVAAGNDNRDIKSTWYSPASYGSQYQGMLTIGSIDAVSAAKSGFSNYSRTHVELGAPGSRSGTSGVLATVLNNGYERLQGTSMASPVAAGAAALVYGFYKARSGNYPTPAEVEEIMLTSAVKDSALTIYIKEGNRLDLVNIKDEIEDRLGAGPDPTPTPTPGPGPDPEC